MKKVLFIIILGMFTLSACKSSSGVSSSNSNKSSTTQNAKKSETNSNSNGESESTGSTGVSNPNGLSTKPVGGIQSTPIKKSPPGSN